MCIYHMGSITYYVSIKARRGILVIIFHFLSSLLIPIDGGAAIGPNYYYRVHPPPITPEILF